MYEITYLVFIRYRGPFGISIPIPRLRTAHLSRPMRPLERFDVAKVLLDSDNPALSQPRMTASSLTA